MDVYLLFLYDILEFWVNYSLGVHKKIGVHRNSNEYSEASKEKVGVQKIAIVKMRIL